MRALVSRSLALTFAGALGLVAAPAFAQQQAPANAPPQQDQTQQQPTGQQAAPQEQPATAREVPVSEAPVVDNAEDEPAQGPEADGAPTTPVMVPTAPSAAQASPAQPQPAPQANAPQQSGTSGRVVVTVHLQGGSQAQPQPVAATVTAPAGTMSLPTEAPPSTPGNDAMGPRPSRHHVWVSGYYGWTGATYVWVAGHWEVPPSRAHRRFEPAHWQLRRRGIVFHHRRVYVYVPARWRR